MAQGAIRNPKQLIRQFVTQVAGEYPIDTIILYGSYARGWQRAWSDIDLAVISAAFDRCTARTWEHVRHLAQTISPHLDARPFGRKEFERHERGDFIHEIRRTGRAIYQKGRLCFPRAL